MIFNIELPNKINKINYFKKVENGCQLYSFNGMLGNDVFVIKQFDLQIENDFAITSSTLEAIQKLQPNVDVKITDKSITAKSSKGKYTGKLLDAKLTLPFMKYEDENVFKANLDILLKATNFSSNNEKKPILTGVNLNANGDIVATDSFKVYRYADKKDDRADNPSNITISANIIKFASSVFNTEEPLNIYFNKNTIMLTDYTTQIVGNLLVGEFPKIENIFKMINGDNHELNRDEILECIEFTKIAGSNVKIKEIGLYATFKKNMFIGNADEVFEKEIVYDGNEIIFECNYLETVLKSFKNNKIYISSQNNGRGNLACFTEESNENEKVVLMGVMK